MFSESEHIFYYTIGSHKLQRNDLHRLITVNQQMLRFPPLQYQLLILLLPGDPILDITLAQALYGQELDATIKRNIEKLARRIRSQLQPLGLTVERVAKQGYILLAIPD